MTAPVTACADCLRRAWLVARLATHFAHTGRRHEALAELFALGDDELIAALARRQRRVIQDELRAVDPDAARRECRSAGIVPFCRHHPAYPPSLAGLPDAPAVLHVRGDPDRLTVLTREPAIALVGARRASPAGREIAAALGRGLSSAGVTVVSGMALGIDSAAHAGALDAGGRTIAVLGCGADVVYPASARRLHARLGADAVVVSEFPPGFRAQRWTFPARNRVIAGLARLTIVVEAGERSGALITAAVAQRLGRDVGAVPGSVTAEVTRGSNALLFDGALMVRDAADALDALLGAGAGARAAALDTRPALEPRLRSLLASVEGGCDTIARIAGAGVEVTTALTGLAELELMGYVRRIRGGAYVAVP